MPLFPQVEMKKWFILLCSDLHMENMMSEQVINILVAVTKWAKCKKYVTNMVFHPSIKQYVWGDTLQIWMQALQKM